MRSLFFAFMILTGAPVILAQASDSLQSFNKWKPSYLRVGYDLARSVSSLTDPNHFSQEISAEVDFHSLILVAESGFARSSFPTVDYEVDGFYYRVGVDANLIPYDKLRSAILFSVRYASSTFQHYLQTNFVDDFGERQLSISENGVSSSWFEAGLGIKVQLIKNLFMGYSFRLRFANNISGDDQLLPAEVPGYGRVFDDGRQSRALAPGFQYGIYWKIPFWNKPVPVKKVKAPKVALPPGRLGQDNTNFNQN